MSYLFFKKNIFGYTWYILNLKNCILYIPGFSFRVVGHAIPCPIHVTMSYVCQVVRRRPANEIQQETALRFEFCIPRHSVHHAQQDLFATAAPADSSFAPGLGWGRRRLGLLRSGAWGFLGVRDSARALGAVTPLAPAMPSTPS